ncbi:hypothetical protein AMEX_G2316 [Astyanax mexicanus]|uniref:Orofacial cleft 1 candidate gene 1 protein n=1 Tax=Astyanax mexicanus TaxID=7994 RepID=A0A8T2MK60_ASTMX|nr:hypothetical protein AMEX_G2316 [Astyanax mexicanus]
MDRFGSKLEQKALKQPKQKKSKSAEFLMEREEQEEENRERRVMKGIVNPGFLSREEEEEEKDEAEERSGGGGGGGQRKEEGREIGGDRQDSTLAAHQQQTELEAPANARGNEGARNYFDPSAAVQGDPRRCRTAGVGAGDELELKFMHEDERGLYEKLSKMLNEDDASTVIDLPGCVVEERTVAGAPKLPLAEWRDRLREQLVERREEVIPQYVEQLRKRVQDDMIPVGRPSLEQDERVERGMREARKQRVMAVLRGNTKASSPVGHVDPEEAVLQERLYSAFQRAERRLLNSLHRRQAEVIAQYGEITEVTVNSEPLAIESDLSWQVEWVRTPRPVEVRVVCLRGVREKLCSGLYSVSVSLHSRLGGPALHWTQLKGQQWSSTTEPVEHKGRFCDIDLQLNQSVCVTLPASCYLLPSTVLVFRLLSMSSEQSPVSGVVAWGAFPVCDCSLTLIQGSFHTPLLWGRPNPGLDQFRKMEQLLSADLDNWLCNLYFQVRILPRGVPLVPECTVPPQIPPGLQPSSSEGTPPDVAASACSSSSLPDKCPPVRALPVPEPSSDQAKPGSHVKGGKQREPISKITSPSGCEREREIGTSLTAEQLQHFSFSTQSERGALCGAVCCGPAARLRMVRRLLPGELGLSCCPRPHFRQLALLLVLVILTWFPRLYLHYCSQWLYLHTRNIPVNRFQFHAHTVDLVYQSSLLRTLEETLLVLLGPLTLNAATFLLLLIRWVCQLAFGSTPSFLSKLIMAVGAWTVLDPLAVFAVDAVLGRLSYSAETPVADAAKLYWHFHRTEQSGTAGIIITLFLYTVLFILSFTVLYVYFFRLHNDGRMLDVYHRLHSPEGVFFIPHDLEVSNQELSYIVKKAEQWRGFNGERRKVAVYDYIWTEEEPAGSESPGGPPNAAGEASTHVSVYTLYLSGLRRRYRHFLRQPNGAIAEVIGDLDSVEAQQSERMAQEDEVERMKGPAHAVRDRKRKKHAWRSNRVGPVGGSDTEPSTTLKDHNH